ncbi:hypothetical protein [Tsukamurella paurometabola]|uniref:Uncharacterized protein n=1 Tax=Tsukamurella paurometabola TaxID=2061 RepID=A0ABS5NH40_TSUPA|nr:hypothetical protein [Tsukamurella paurometabola]MBS4103345.1 hypothetical protein [Tsukamurella paurometabola]
MSEERRISLAELLAREGEPAPAPTGGRRRRHRGGENSITVAELTGEIPVVRDDAPAPGADTRAAQTEAQAAPAAPQAPQAPTTPQAAPQAQQAPAEPEVVTPEVEPEAAAPAAEPASAPRTDVPPQPDQDDDEPITSSFLAAAVADPGPAEAPAQQEPEAPAVDETPAPDEAPAARESRRSGLLRWNRGAKAQEREATAPSDEPAEADQPADAPAAEAPAAAQAADAPSENAPSENAPSEDDGKDYAWSRWDQAETPIMATADFNTAQVRERQSRFAEVEADDTVDVKPVAVPAPDVDAPAAPDTASMSAQQIDDARAEATPDFLAKTGDDVADEDADEKSGGKGRGWLLLAGEVLLGLVAGAGLFYGFFKLWNWGGGKATIALTVVLAFIVIIGIVTFTHYLRKTTDYLTLGLALFVGLVITFGPLLMALGSN